MRIKQRKILWYLVFVGFGINYMQRCNLNIAIIDMIDSTQQNSKVTENDAVNECINEEQTFINETKDTPINYKRVRTYSLERHLLSYLSV